jgi:hypothetical protein
MKSESKCFFSCYLIVVVALLTGFTHAVEMTNLTAVSWSHGTNSQNLLNDVLECEFIEQFNRVINHRDKIEILFYF